MRNHVTKNVYSDPCVYDQPCIDPLIGSETGYYFDPTKLYINAPTIIANDE